MSIAFFLLTFFIIRFLRKNLRTSVRIPRLDKMLMAATTFAVVLLLAEIVLPNDNITKWVWHCFMLALVGLLFYLKKIESVQRVLIAIVPFIFISLLQDLVQAAATEFYNQISNYYSSAKAFSIIWLFAVWFNNQKQQKALETERRKRLAEEEQRRLIAVQNLELEQIVSERTAELTRQAAELQRTLDELKATQVQLIQREKLASLGDLTAGIAHEIQNPLNFINNFSEVNKELIGEMQHELQTGDKEEAIAIAQLIEQNLEKINNHGRRADSIVKGMLQHSRASSGQKEPTDLNALADEYLRLAYHGLRAKDKEFNARLITNFDNNISKVAVVPQEIGRVLLNLFNNAFYATQQKKQLLNGQYQPEIIVSTSCQNGKVEIKIRDNGCGIPQSVKSKILQPFFTTKPAGQGTGLGLSLSYEIITKAHGGELIIESKEGEYSEFIIQLP